MRDCPYDDPNCTGKHRGNLLKAEMCPSAYERKQERMRERYATDAKLRERRREQNREWSRDYRAKNLEQKREREKLSSRNRRYRQRALEIQELINEG